MTAPVAHKWLSPPDLHEVCAALTATAMRDRLAPWPDTAAVADVAAVRVWENCEPLVEVPESLAPTHLYERLSIDSLPPQMLLRSGLVARLGVAQSALPQGFGLCVLDGYRTSAFQVDLRARYEDLAGRDLGMYVADPRSTTLVAPHTTGGAVDLTLTFNCAPMALGTDFDAFEDRAHGRALETAEPACTKDRLYRDLRRLLAQALMGAGLAPYPEEWWHWSFGEQRWAAHYGEPTTLYAPIEA